MFIPSTHGDKLNALLDNNKLPNSDKIKVKEAIGEYNIWRNALLNLRSNGKDIVSEAVKLLNEYKNYIEIDLIFSSVALYLNRKIKILQFRVACI